MDIEKIIPGLKKGVSLKDYTTFKTGGKARYFFEVKTRKDLIKAVKAARNSGVPFFLLGGGSNLIADDKGYRGLIVRCQMPNIKYQRNGIIYAEAGVKLSDLAVLSSKKSLTGLEWAAGIPGTIGGAVCGNAGWREEKNSISSVVKSVEVLDVGPKLKINKISAKDCNFGYRNSVFKHNKNLIVLGAFLELKKGDKKKIEEEISDILKKRSQKIPAGFSAGSVFKNPEGRYAGELIEKCGLKGKKIGGAKISENHANFIINSGSAKSKDIEALMDLAKKEVKRKFGIILKEEIQHLK